MRYSKRKISKRRVCKRSCKRHAKRACKTCKRNHSYTRRRIMKGG